MTDLGGFPKVFGEHLLGDWGRKGRLRAQSIKIVSRSRASRSACPWQRVASVHSRYTRNTRLLCTFAGALTGPK